MWIFKNCVVGHFRFGCFVNAFVAFFNFCQIQKWPTTQFLKIHNNLYFSTTSTNFLSPYQPEICQNEVQVQVKDFVFPLHVMIWKFHIRYIEVAKVTKQGSHEVLMEVLMRTSWGCFVRVALEINTLIFNRKSQFPSFFMFFQSEITIIFIFLEQALIS